MMRPYYTKRSNDIAHKKLIPMMRRALLTLHCCGVIGGKFLSEINSNEYFLIKQKIFDFLIFLFILSLAFKF